MLEKLKKVVEGDYCVGCGACAYIGNSSMRVNKFGEYQPNLNEFNSSFSIEKENLIESVCPFLFPSENEDSLSNKFIDSQDNFSEKIGYYSEIYGGYVMEGEFRDKGTSGGTGTWIGAELFRLGLIDGVIHVKPSTRNKSTDPFYKYAISKTLDDIILGAKSKYHVVEVSEVLKLVEENHGKYLFIGVPCLVKSIRRIQLINPIIKESIPYTVSLVCGHFKSINWTLSLGWAKGIHPSELDSFQYRTKGEDIEARKYVFRAGKNDENKTVIQEDSANVTGGKFNQGALMLNACNFCDDVVGETADLTIGDAWLPQFEADNNGTNLLIIRNAQISKVFKNAEKEGRIKLTQISEKDAINSQSGGFRQRREGLSFRLLQKEKLKKWYPVKRIKPGQFEVSPLRKQIYKKRQEVTLKTKDYFVEALDKNDYNYYSSNVKKDIQELRQIELRSIFFKAAMNKLSRIYEKIKIKFK